MKRRKYDELSRFVDDDGWTDWQNPIQQGYRMKCCDCGLVHVFDFRVDDEGLVQFRVSRDNRATAASRRKRK